MADLTITPDTRLSPMARFVRWALIGLYRLRGWKAEGKVPETFKFVLCGASHTSNWDFIVFLGVTEDFGIYPRFMGKHTLFKWPMRNFMIGLGGVPVDRSCRKDMVAQMVDQFAAHEEFALVVAAEGTRSPNANWKTGFYRIAEAAQVPILFAGPDYKRKRGVFGPMVMPTGDYDADMAVGIEFFKTLHPKYPRKALFPDGSSRADYPD